MAPVRLDLTARLCRRSSACSTPPGVQVGGAGVASDDLLGTVHDLGLRRARCSTRPSTRTRRRGARARHRRRPRLRRHARRQRPACCRPASTAPTRCGAGEVRHAVNFCGGLHHAMRDRASGFCVYNDVAAAIAAAARRRRREGRLRRRRRAPRRRHAGAVLGRPAGADRLGARDRPGAVPRHRVRRRDRRSAARRAPRSTWPCRPAPATAAGCARSTPWCPRWCGPSRPDALVTQHGCDTHALDPLAHLAVSLDAQRAVATIAARPGARGVRRPLGRHRRGRVRDRRRRPAVVVAPGRHRRARAGRPRRRRSPTAWRDHVRQRFGRHRARCG